MVDPCYKHAKHLTRPGFWSSDPLGALDPACPKGAAVLNSTKFVRPLVATGENSRWTLSTCCARGPRLGAGVQGGKGEEAVCVGPMAEKERRPVKSQI